MPIEFACIHCGRKLRTPEGSAGKRAKCPGCQQIVQIPADGQETPEPDDDNESSSSATSSAAPNPVRPAPRPREASAAASNPYAAPKSAETWTAGTGGSLGVTGDLSLGNVSSQAWRLLRERLVDAILLSLVLMGINVALVLASTALQVVAGGDGTVEAIASLVMLIVQVAMSAVIMLPLINFATNRISGQPGLQQLFRKADRIPRLLGIAFIWMLIIFGVSLVMGIIGGVLAVGAGAALGGVGAVLIVIFYLVFSIVIYAIMLSFLVAPWLVINRDARAIESMRLSAQYMKGKRLSSFAILFVLGALGGLVLLVTLGLAALVMPAYFALVWGLMCALIVPPAPAESQA